MQGKSYSSMLQELSRDYYNHRISFEEYREKRRQILEYIDQQFNGRNAGEVIGSCGPLDSDDEATIPYSSYE